jgi:uncharacterized protein
MLNIARLLPSETKFYRLLEKLADHAAFSAQKLSDFVAAPPEGRAAFAAEIAECRKAAKAASAEVTKELCLTFVTPFDRDDIQKFSLNLYKIVKTTEKVCDYMQMYGMRDVSDLAGQAGVIVREAEAMGLVVRALTGGADPDTIMRKARLLDTLENEGDEILKTLLVRLIKDTGDVRELILKKDAYDMLERVIDKYRDAAGIAIQIALKHT